MNAHDGLTWPWGSFGSATNYAPGLRDLCMHSTVQYPRLEKFELAGEKMKIKPPFFAFEHTI